VVTSDLKIIFLVKNNKKIKVLVGDKDISENLLRLGISIFFVDIFNFLLIYVCQSINFVLINKIMSFSFLKERNQCHLRFDTNFLPLFILNHISEKSSKKM
jgi:hypothetical protein